MNRKTTLASILASSLLIAVGTQSYACDIYVPATSGYKIKADTQTIAPDLRRSNVPTTDGRFVFGFQVIGGGEIKWYTDSENANEPFAVDVEILPDNVKSYDLVGIAEFLGYDVDTYRRVAFETEAYWDSSNC